MMIFMSLSQQTVTNLRSVLSMSVAPLGCSATWITPPKLVVAGNRFGGSQDIEFLQTHDVWCEISCLNETVCIDPLSILCPTLSWWIWTLYIICGFFKSLQHEVPRLTFSITAWVFGPNFTLPSWQLTHFDDCSHCEEMCSFWPQFKPAALCVQFLVVYPKRPNLKHYSTERYSLTWERCYPIKMHFAHFKYRYVSPQPSDYHSSLPSWRWLYCPCLGRRFWFSSASPLLLFL